jgi:hypothetical protein
MEKVWLFGHVQFSVNDLVALAIVRECFKVG